MKMLLTYEYYSIYAYIWDLQNYVTSGLHIYRWTYFLTKYIFTDKITKSYFFKPFKNMITGR